MLSAFFSMGSMSTKEASRLWQEITFASAFLNDATCPVNDATASSTYPFVRDKRRNFRRGAPELYSAFNSD